jgi:hypothetical protein
MTILTKTIKARVNQLAHRRGQQCALLIRDTTLGTLQGMAEAGKSIEELSRALDEIEADSEVLKV